MELQRELNDHLALIRILDPPSPFGDFRPLASEPALGSNKQRRETLLNFVAFCLARDGNTVALAATIHCRSSQGNQLVLHVARSTGSTTSYERERAMEFLGDLKRAWRYQTYWHMQIVLGHVVQMTTHKLRKRLKKLRDALHDLNGTVGFTSAVNTWGKQESSPDIIRWMNTCQCESPTAALKDVVHKLCVAAHADDFDTPHLFDATLQYRLYHSYLLPVAVLLGSQFLHDIEFGHTSLPSDLVQLIRRLRRRCIKLRWYEIGIQLLCTCARDTVRRVLGVGAFNNFICEEEDDAFTIEWLETPHAMPKPLPRKHTSAQAALLCVLASITDASDSDEPFACTIAHKPAASTYWTPTCVATYHPELQVIDHLRLCDMRPSPAYIGCSRLACRACKWYIDQLEGGKWALYTKGMDTIDLEVPTDWLIPPSDTGWLCASIIREEAARLVLREDNIQRIAWEMRSTSESVGLDDLETTVRVL